ncbi:cyclic beta-1,2-glucan ABC transporter [Pseudolabrys sp. Root1462]|uniref:glucan ABC transporter ATP-binding protein/ permease n=1 Tax=Pseudolabrys sp. Root1462 TaxID=1736466 RepID=UPI000703881D|nr:glucan ABC transporter ATP-binding protein/ permease [Pseudolabrys sp. Root1462]KQZ01958.1 cyclic beta-1,2-glucan ABC transporter [Pseudolabrys sp. Root1462]
MALIRLYTRVLALLGSEARLAWAIAFGNLALAVAQFAEPVLLGRIIDTLSVGQASGTPPSWQKLSALMSAWAGFGIFTIVAGTLIALYADRLAHRRRQVVLTRYFEHVLELPLSYHGNTHSGRLMKVMLEGTDALWGLWLGFFREHFAAMIGLLVLLPVSLIINWRLASLLILLCAVFAFLTAIIVRKTGSMQEEVNQHYSDLAERASDTLGNIALVQSFSRLEQEVTELRQIVEKLLAAQMPVLSWWALATVLTRTATTLAVLAIIVVGTWLTLRGEASIGEMVTFMSFAGLIISRMEHTVAFVDDLVSHAGQLIEFFQVWDTVPDIRDRPGAIDPGRLTGNIRFNDVSFSYDGRRQAADHLNFSVNPGETIALVGATGAGKSTAIALLHRAFDPQSGSIEADGRDIRDIKLAALRRNIGVVFQEALLFNRSIAENLRVGKPDASDDEIRDAARRAQALEFIDRKFHGFKEVVGERGRSLSGGERQRLSIARALLKNPPILILDEATSALDAATESKVMAALDEVMKDRTTFVIAHRLSTVRNATRILVFEHGRIIESGTFDELVAQGGRFTELAKAQFMVAGDKARAFQTPSPG